MDGQYRFYADPFLFFDRHGTKLVRLVTKASSGDNPEAIGRDPQVYQALYSEVRRWFLESQFEQHGVQTSADVQHLGASPPAGKRS